MTAALEVQAQGSDCWSGGAPFFGDGEGQIAKTCSSCDSTLEGVYPAGDGCVGMDEACDAFLSEHAGDCAN